MLDFQITNMETIRRWIRANRPNGQLTSKSALKILAVGLNIAEKELLEEFEQEPDIRNTARVDSNEPK